MQFIKMNGSGNDFVVFDARKNPISLTTEQIIRLSARDNKETKGCDQLIILELSKNSDIFMRIYNADGGQVDACGNATRCIAYLLEKELRKLPVSIETNAGILRGVKKENDSVLVDMGKAKFAWQDIPLAVSLEEAAKKVAEFSGLENPVFVSMGNPHAVFFMDKVPSDEVVQKLGSKIENYTEIFPKKVNVSFAVLKDNKNIEAKVWERGAGMTQACGTAACAMFAAANKNNNAIKNVTVSFLNSGQSVRVSIAESKNILLGGAVEIEFSAYISTVV